MSLIPYEDFELQITPGEERGVYRSKVLRSAYGNETVLFSISEIDFESLLQSASPPTPDAAKRFGGSLFNSVFKGEINTCLRSSLDVARFKGSRLRIRLNLTEVPELASLPWEYLYNPLRNLFYARSVDTPIVRFLEQADTIEKLTVTEPLRILVMMALPSDRVQLDVQEEWQKLQAALVPLEEQGLVEIEQLEVATTAALRDKLRLGGKDYHIFHFVGHGHFNNETGEGSLVIENEHKRGRQVSGEMLGEILRSHDALRLAVINACEGGRLSEDNSYSGVAQNLLIYGRIPAVIAMQYEITDDAAIQFAGAFYGALAAGYPVDAALSDARMAIYTSDNDVEWGTPVLYMRSPSGDIFDVEQISEQARRQARINALYRHAQAALDRQDWALSIEKLQALLSLDQTHARARTALGQARKAQEAASLYDTGKKDYEAGNWTEALNDFYRVRSLIANYKDVDALIADAQTRGRAATAARTPVVTAPGGNDPLEAHYTQIARLIGKGSVVPFLGTNANLCGRPEGAAWQRGQYPPSGCELAEYLASSYGYPLDDVQDLLRVSQYVSVVEGPGSLNQELYSLFNVDYRLTPLHEFLASLPSRLGNTGMASPYQLIVTTNYDDVLERAFAAVGEPFDLVSYVAEGEDRGKFSHKPPDEPTRTIKIPNEYADLSLDKRTVILKLHGAVDRLNPDRDSCVITEDHYIDYLTRTDISNVVPVQLAAKLRRSHFLFLGYSLRDWNLRAILHRIWGDQKRGFNSWATQLNPDAIDTEFWRRRDVNILNVCLEDYIAALNARL